MAARKPRSTATETGSTSAEGTVVVTAHAISRLSGDATAQELLHRVISSHTAGLKAQSVAVLHGVRCGEWLIALKERVGHGHFGPVLKWLEDNHRISERTMQRYMKLAQHRELVVDTLRALNPPELSDFPDEQILEQTNVTQALRLIAVSPRKRDTSESTEFKEIRFAKWHECHFPSDVAAALPRVWTSADVFLSRLDEAIELPIGTSQPATRLSDEAVTEVSGRVLVNAVRKETPTQLLNDVAARFREGTVTEAFIVLPCSANPHALAEVLHFPRLYLREQPHVEVNSPAGKARCPYPCTVMIVLLTKTERIAELATSFAEWRSSDHRSIVRYSCVEIAVELASPLFTRSQIMASIFKSRMTRYLDADGKRVPKDTPGARKVQERSKKWYGEYRDEHNLLRRVAARYRGDDAGRSRSRPHAVAERSSDR